MPSDIPNDLHSRLEHLAKATGQHVSMLVCETIAQRLACEEQSRRPQGSPAWQPFTDQDPLVALIGSCEHDASVYD